MEEHHHSRHSDGGRRQGHKRIIDQTPESVPGKTPGEYYLHHIHKQICRREEQIGDESGSTRSKSHPRRGEAQQGNGGTDYIVRLYAPVRLNQSQERIQHQVHQQAQHREAGEHHAVLRHIPEPQAKQLRRFQYKWQAEGQQYKPAVFYALAHKLEGVGLVGCGIRLCNLWINGSQEI